MIQLSHLRLAHRGRVTSADLEALAHDPFGTDDPSPTTFHSMPRKITQEEAEERFCLEMQIEEAWLNHCADVSGQRAVAA